MSTEHFITINGIRYHVRIEGDGSPVLLLHGFTGSADTWSGLMEAYKEQYSFIAVDLLGHGQTDSPEHHERYGMEAAADDLKVLLDFLGRKPVHLLGYSMGGRLALGFAVRYPEYVKSLILESSSPGLKTIEEQDVRIMHDAALAGRILDIGVERFTDEWSRLPLFASQERLPQEAKERVRAERLAQKAIGLAGSLKGMGTGSQPSLWEDLASLQIPVLVLAGEFDLKFVRIAKQMADTLPNHEMHIFEDAGHAIHVEKPAEFGRIVNEYFKRRKYNDD